MSKWIYPHSQRLTCTKDVINDVVDIAWPDCWCRNALLSTSLQTHEGMWRNVLATLREFKAAIVTVYFPHQWRSTLLAMVSSPLPFYHRNISSFNVIHWDLKPFITVGCSNLQWRRCWKDRWGGGALVLSSFLLNVGWRRDWWRSTEGWLTSIPQSFKAMMPPPVAKNRILLTTPEN